MTELAPQPPAPLARDIAAQWCIRPDIAYLNHGCFGARPRVVFEAQEALRRRFEAEPVQVLHRDRDTLIGDAKEIVGRFLGMAPDDFGFVTNATGAIASVLRSMTFEPGDEVLTTNHVYNAVRQTLVHLSARHDFTYTELDVPFPTGGPDAIVDLFRAALSDRTRLVIIDEITSPTALRLPLRRIIDLCDERGVDVFIDGAHAPGSIELDVASFGAAYYTGNLHKWVSAPVGAAFLWVRPDRQADVHPLTISHFYGTGLSDELNWQGTRDITPWLCVPTALAYFDGLGWPAVREHNHRMAAWVQRLLCERWQVEPGSPLDGSMLATMATVALPGDWSRFKTILDLETCLYDDHGIELPVIPRWNDRWYIRCSCQVYNTPVQYERLADVILELMA